MKYYAIKEILYISLILVLITSKPVVKVKYLVPKRLNYGTIINDIQKADNTVKGCLKAKSERKKLLGKSAGSKTKPKLQD